MNEFKDNIKCVTEDEIIALTNNEKRRVFAEQFENWGVWIDIPELTTKVYKAVFPDGSEMIVTYQKRFVYNEKKYDWGTAYYNYLTEEKPYLHHGDSVSAICDILKQMKIMLQRNRKNDENENREVKAE